MKNIFLISLVITIVSVAGFAGDDIITNSSGNQFTGTWTGIDEYGDKVRLVVTNTAWIVTWLEYPGIIFSGTYTYTGNAEMLFMPREGGAGKATVSENEIDLILNGVLLIFTRENSNYNDYTFIGTWIGFDFDGDETKLVMTDTTWTMSWPDFPAITESGTYTYDGNVLLLIVDYPGGGSFSMTAAISGNSMTLTALGMSMTLTRQ